MLLWSRFVAPWTVLPQGLKYDLAHRLTGRTCQRAGEPRSLGITDMNLVFHRQQLPLIGGLQVHMTSRRPATASWLNTGHT
jgi:hypothetical protein